ncbi:MAG: SGNH/GDSL hydrolase family protein [Planctomycetota bacterium]|nr:MAG: SGNH/GDSL hydrolase family protein [Planctomycetota bacterium]
MSAGQAWRRLRSDDTRLAWWSPRPPRPDPLGRRCERFSPVAQQLLQGQIGPLANIRSAAGCALCLRSDSPALILHLARLRHHQPVPQQIALQWRCGPDGPWHTVSSADLREREGAVDLWLPTGLAAGQLAEMWLWLPNISTCLVAGISVVETAEVAPLTLPKPRWLAIGDSLTQGFNAACPTTTWVHRLAMGMEMPVWNLGVGGLRIEAELFAEPLAAQDWDLVTVALGSNHAWRAGDADPDVVAGRARELCDLALAASARRLVWILPPWKPCEEGLGPPEFFGVPLDRSAGQRAETVRRVLSQVLSDYAGRIEVVADCMPHDHRLLADGLHPQALGMARYAERVARALAEQGMAEAEKHLRSEKLH